LIKFSHPAITQCFDLFWYDKILPMNKKIFNTSMKVIFLFDLIKVVLALIILVPLPFLAPVLVNYKQDKKNIEDSKNHVERRNFCFDW
jgi:type IV secretory pathway component VirB8